MALFRDLESANSQLLPTKDGDEYTRTHTKMVVDNGDAPSGKKIPDPRLPKLFKYHFGGQDGYVVIPKGRIVAIDPEIEVQNFEDNKYYNAITIANGGEDVEERNDDPSLDNPGEEDYIRKANKPVGVAGLNVYQNIDNSFRGNVPMFITRNTINLPYFLDKEEAEKMDWGSAYGTDLKPGDKVKSDENGRFVKWNDPMEFETWDEAKEEGDSAAQIVGQVININKEFVPAGWLQWVSSESPNGDEENMSGYEAQHLDPETGFPYDPEYRDGIGDKGYEPEGIEGLTDGSALKKKYEDEKVGEVLATFEEGDRVNVRTLNTPVCKEELEVKLVNDDGEVVFDNEENEDLVDFVNYDEGLIILEMPEDVEEDLDVLVTYEATGEYPGMPSNINWEGVAGSVDILLQL